MAESTLSTGTQKQKVLFKCSTNDLSPVVIAGDAPELGEWSLGGAAIMQRQPGQNGGWDWSAQIELPLGHTVEYKFVRKSDRGPRWESGINHRITIIPGLSTLNEDFRE